MTSDARKTKRPYRQGTTRPVTPELYPQVVAALREERNAKRVGLAFGIGQSRARRIAKLENIDLIPRGAYAREERHRDAVRQAALRSHKDAAFVAAQRAGRRRFYADPVCRKRHAHASSEAASRRWAREREARARERQVAIAEHRTWAQTREGQPHAAPTEQAQALRAFKLRQQARRDERQAAKVEREGEAVTYRRRPRATPSDQARAVRAFRLRQQARRSGASTPE
jgi:hypothetical protein